MVDISILGLSLGVGIDVDSLGTNFTVPLSKSFRSPPLLEDGLVC